MDLIQTEIGLWFAFAAAGTAVADCFHSAGLALLAEIWFVEILIGNFEAELTGQLEVNRPALIAQTRFIRLICL